MFFPYDFPLICSHKAYKGIVSDFRNADKTAVETNKFAAGNP